MLQAGILIPGINLLLSRARQTDTLIISGRGFPCLPEIETVDISLIADIPRVVQVLNAIRENFKAGRAFMAQEFYSVNSPGICEEFEQALNGLHVTLEPHALLKRRASHAAGLIRTGDTTRFGDIVIELARSPQGA